MSGICAKCNNSVFCDEEIVFKEISFHIKCFDSSISKYGFVETIKKPQISDRIKNLFGGRETPPLIPNESLIPELNKEFIEINLVEDSSSQRQNIFYWMNEGQYLQTEDDFDPKDFFISGNENENENIFLKSKIPYYNPYAVHLKKDNNFYSTREKFSLSCIQPHSVFKNTKQGRELYYEGKLGLMDIYRNWRFRPWINDNGLLVTDIDSNLHKTRAYFNETNIEITLPEYRKEFYSIEVYNEVMKICNEDNKLQIEINNYCELINSSKVRREFTQKERKQYLCGLCNIIVHLPIVCQDKNSISGTHLFCYWCIQEFIIKNEINICCEMHIVDCPFRCKNFISISNNKRPPLEDRYKILTFSDNCQSCTGRFSTSKLREHFYDCLDNSNNKKLVKKINQLKFEKEKIKKDADKKYQELEYSKYLGKSELNKEIETLQNERRIAYAKIDMLEKFINNKDIKDNKQPKDWKKSRFY